MGSLVDSHIHTHTPYLCLLLHDGEDPLDADADAHTGHLPALGVEHAHQAVVSPAARHAAHAHALLARRSVLGLGGDRGRRHARLGQDGFVDDAGVVVQTARQTEVKHHLGQKREEGTQRVVVERV